MRASAAVVAELDPAGGDKPRLVELRSAPPLTLRWADGSLYIVGSAFAPLGGDELELAIDVGEGASLSIRTVAASVAQPGHPGRADLADSPERGSHTDVPDSEVIQSRFRVTARVAAGATLRWLPEPGVATQGCHHVNDAHLELDASAQVVWREEVVLGRSGEPGGEWRSVMDASLGGEPLLYQDTLIGGPAWEGPAVGGGARAAGSLLLVGPEAPAEPSVHTADDPADPRGANASPPTGRAAVMPLAHPGAAVVSALAADARTLRRLLSP